MSLNGLMEVRIKYQIVPRYENGSQRSKMIFLPKNTTRTTTKAMRATPLTNKAHYLPAQIRRIQTENALSKWVSRKTPTTLQVRIAYLNLQMEQR